MSGVRTKTLRAQSRRRWFLPCHEPTCCSYGWALLLQHAYDWHPSGWSVLRKQEAAVKPQRREGENYTRSIVIVPGGGDLCWQRIIDNRTGKMWDKGYVNCYEAVAPQEKDQRVGMSSARINAIGKAFNHDN